ncbi:transcriptional regulator [Vibrio tasmaniensis]|nr:transcriptional regulator [Vibrio tasmaniensis]
MKLSFSKFIEKIREKQDLTQQQLVDTLIESDEKLQKLDLTTISRWERGITVPKLSKQLLIARIMGEDVGLLIDPKEQAPKNKQNSFNILKNRTLNPYISNSEHFECHQYNSLQDQREVCQLLTRFHHSFLDMNISMESLQQCRLYLNLYQTFSGDFVGHFLYGFLQAETQPKVLAPEHLIDCPFIDETNTSSQPIDMYVVSSFSSLSRPRMLNILTILNSVRNNTKIKNLIVNCHSQEAFDLYETAPEHEILTKGDETTLRGVKVFGRTYKYVQLKINAESLLSSKVVSSLVPNTEENIMSLLGDKTIG